MALPGSPEGVEDGGHGSDREAIGQRIAFYNRRRPHTAHGGQPPVVVYFCAIETDQQVPEVA